MSKADLRTALNELATHLIFQEAVQAANMRTSAGCRKIVAYVVDEFERQAGQTPVFTDDAEAAIVKAAVGNDYQWSRVWREIEGQMTSIGSVSGATSTFEIIGGAVIEVTDAEAEACQQKLPEQLLQQVVDIVIDVIKAFNK